MFDNQANVVMKNIKKPKVFDVPPLDYIAMSTAHELKKSKKRCEKKSRFEDSVQYRKRCNSN